MIVKTVCFRDYEPIGGKQQVERIDIEQKLLRAAWQMLCSKKWLFQSKCHRKHKRVVFSDVWLI